MVVEKLSTQFALKPGAQVWFLPEKPVSSWAKYLDWHMNFLIANSSQRIKKNLTDSLQSTLTQAELNFDFKAESKHDIVLLSTQSFLPNNATILVKQCPDLGDWIQKIQDTIDRLKITTARIFLPKGVSIQQINPLLKKKFDDIQLSLVEDHGHEK